MPAGAQTGYLNVYAGVNSNNVPFTVGPSGTTPPSLPHITGLSQNSAAVGTTITITGTNFGAYNRYWLVNFGGRVFAKPTEANWSDTSITVTVPEGADTGPLNVYADGVNSNSLPFTVVP